LGIVEQIFLLLMGVLLFWTLYNLPILVKGVDVIRGARASTSTKQDKGMRPDRNLPFFSIIIAAKNEEKVIGRLLESALQLDYPKERIQIVVAEDGSYDRTREICEQYAKRHPDVIEFCHREPSGNKPGALNYALAKASGDIVAILDADNIPEKDILQRAAARFEDTKVAAVQGHTYPINLHQNFLTRLEAYNQDSWFKIYLRGKDSLNLFMPLTGSCGFVRRDILLECGGWNEKSLTEDVELAARLAAKNHRIQYAPEIRSWQENTSSFRQMIKQRRRWFRGYMETLLNCRRLITQGSLIGIDVGVTLLGPLIIGFCFLTNTIGVYGLVSGNLDIGWPLMMVSFATGVLTLETLIVCAAGLFYQSRKRRWRNLVWAFPLVMYWELQMAVAFYTTLCFLLRRPQSWEKTEKTGSTDRFNK